MSNIMHNCLPREIDPLIARREVASLALRDARAVLQLRHQLHLLQPGAYIPAGDLEDQVRQGEKAIAAIDAEQRKLLRMACVSCSQHATCPASMVRPGRMTCRAPERGKSRPRRCNHVNGGSLQCKVGVE